MRNFSYLIGDRATGDCVVVDPAYAANDLVDALEADDVVRSALPGEMYNVFMHYKRDEWERYCATVTDWDVNEYLDVLP